MQAASETPGLMRSDGSRHFPRQLLPVWRQVNSETKGTDPVFAEAPDQESDSHFRLLASRAGEQSQPPPDRLREQRENYEVPFPHHPELRRSLRPPRRRAVSSGRLAQPVRHCVPARRYGQTPDKHLLDPASTGLGKDSNVLLSDNLR